MSTQHVVYIGDVCEVLKKYGPHIRALCAPHLIMTSPPYAQGKEYERGLTYDGLWALMAATAQVCHEVARPGGFFCINFGETTKYDKFPPSRQAPDESCDFTMSHLFTVTMKQAGWRIHSRRVWKKCFPRIRAAAYNHTMTIPVAEFENVWTWRKPGGDRERRPENHDHMRAVWDSSEAWEEKAGTEKYPTPYPLIIPRTAIQIWTRPGEWVLDPFAGSGTTSLAAGLAGRNSISVELFKDYVPILREKLAKLRACGHKVFFNEQPSALELPSE